ncbi:MAG: O-antigen ligase family protein [Armatimonadetes bacterium]|jgi:O-antigen ligase|nr:O-antigen ligase family protein [Armatimonadota bacterium]
MSVKDKQGSGLYWALLLLIVVAPTQWGIEVKGIPATPADLVLAVAFLGWVVLAARRRAALGLPPACLWALVAVALVSAANATKVALTGQGFAYMAPGYEFWGTPMKAVAELAQLIEYLLVVYVLVWAAVRSERQVFAAAQVLAAITVGVVLLGLVHYLTRSGSDAFQVASTFGSRHIYGGYLAMALPVVFSLALTARGWPARVGLLAVIVVGAVTILSPGALIGLGVALLLVAARVSGRALQATLAAVLAFGALTAVALPRNYEHNVYQFAHFRTADGQALRAQWREWLAGAQLVREHPLLGVGPGNFQQNIGTAYGQIGQEYPGKARPGADLAAGLMEPDTNSLYVVTASSMGLLGLAALLWVLLYFGKVASAAARRLEGRAIGVLAAGLWGGIIGFAVTSIFSSLMVRGTGVVLGLLMALAAVLCFREWPVEPNANALHVI